VRSRLPRPTRRGRLALGVGGLVLVAGAVTTAVVVTTADPAPVASVAPSLDVASGPQAAPGLSEATMARLRGILDQPEPPAPAPVAATPSEPVRVVIPSIGVDAGVVPVSAPDQALLPPSDPDLLGWWADGAQPGAPRGSALITGHSVHTGGGALQDLGDVGRGDEVVVETEDGSIDYAVTSTVVLDKPALAREAATLFSQEADGRVVLITCADWNGTEWLSNTVVTADPVTTGA